MDLRLGFLVVHLVFPYTIQLTFDPCVGVRVRFLCWRGSQLLLLLLLLLLLMLLLLLLLLLMLLQPLPLLVLLPLLMMALLFMMSC